MRLEGMKALVTGAGRGIGKGIALALAREGTDIVLHYNQSARTAEELAHEIESLGRRAIPVKANMGNISEVRRLIAKATEELGGLDILVNNAAITANHDFFDISTEKSRISRGRCRRGRVSRIGRKRIYHRTGAGCGRRSVVASSCQTQS